MSAVLSAATLFAVVAFVPKLSATTSRAQLARVHCQAMHIYDPLSIRKCMGYYFDLCAVGKETAKREVLNASAVKFGKCLGESNASWIFDSSTSMPKKSEVCANRFTTNLVKFEDFDKCYKLLNETCEKWSEVDRGNNLRLILHAAVCVLQGQPMYSTPEMWTQVACFGLGALHNRTMKPIQNVIEGFQDLFGCPKPPVPTPPAC